MYNKLVDLRQHSNAILSFEEWECISNYLISIVNNNKIEEINCICSLIDNSPNGIDRTLVDSLLQLVHEYEERQQQMKQKMESMGLRRIRRRPIIPQLHQPESVPPQENPHEHQEKI